MCTCLYTLPVKFHFPSINGLSFIASKLQTKEHFLPFDTLFYVYGSVHRRSILIIVQRNATQTNLFIILQVHSTFFGCQPHPSSGIHKTVTIASGSVQLPPSSVAKLAWPRWREVAAPVPKAVVTVLCTPDDGCG